MLIKLNERERKSRVTIRWVVNNAFLASVYL